MADYVIEDDVPMPRLRTGTRLQYPFSEMDIGQSFLVGTDSERVRIASAQYARRHGVKFSMQRTAEGYRVWRVE